MGVANFPTCPYDEVPGCPPLEGTRCSGRPGVLGLPVGVGLLGRKVAGAGAPADEAPEPANGLDETGGLPDSGRTGGCCGGREDCDDWDGFPALPAGDDVGAGMDGVADGPPGRGCCRASGRWPFAVPGLGWPLPVGVLRPLEAGVAVGVD
ncbi:hypothetical protein AB0P21_32305 [Kribbella sp. NPDC056861]|uniref:hypothetical protein n=1 Tax=Kribbella sp. NPDC056861 TaxID=3154857 RepID=UPI003446F702